MTWELRGRTVFVTGAARGIGAETARRVAAAGANVAVVGLEPEELGARGGAVRPQRRPVRVRRDRLAGARARRRGDGRALRRHRRRDGERGHRAGRHGPLDGPGGVREDPRGQPARRVAHRAQLPAADHRAQGLRPGDGLAGGRRARAGHGRLRGQQGGRRGVRRLAALRGQAARRRRRRGLLRVHRHRHGARDGHASVAERAARRLARPARQGPPRVVGRPRSGRRHGAAQPLGDGAPAGCARC